LLLGVLLLLRGWLIRRCQTCDRAKWKQTRHLRANQAQSRTRAHGAAGS
jgi:hypothetical protein